MKAHSKIELALIPVVVAAVGFSAHWLPDRLGVGELLVTGCLGWLVQGGIRDLWLLHLLRTRPASTPQRRMACMCFESSAGLTGILIGVVLALTGIGGHVTLDAGGWMALTAGVLTMGFLLKDVVITWRPFGLRREPDHHSIIFAWR